MGILGLIASNNFIAVNKDLIKAFGLEGAVIIGELASEYNYWEMNGGIDDDGFFYSTSENIENNTGLKEARQRTVVNALKKQGVIIVRLKGLPAKRHFKINEEQLVRILTGNSFNSNGTSTANFAELDPQNKPINNNNLNNNNKNNNNYKEIIEFLNEKAHTNYRATSKATQEHINARLKEGFTVEDFKTVITKKCTEWLGDEKMQQYLRPATLFGTKFESYLNAPLAMRKSFGKTGIEIKNTDDDALDGIL